MNERLLHQESKFKEKVPIHSEDSCKALIVNQKKNPRKQFTCHYCHRPGYFKKDCRKYLATQQKQGASMAANEKRERLTYEALATVHAPAATSIGSWVVDSGATCHMCSDKNMFVDLTQLNTPQRVTLGDGSSLEGPTDTRHSLTKWEDTEVQNRKCSLHSQAVLQFTKCVKSI